MYMNHQPNVNTWKCHNPQWRVLGEFFAGGGKNIPFFYCNISRREDAVGLLATRASESCGAPDPGGERGGGEDVAAEGGASSLSQVFSKRATKPASESNYSPIKDKDVTREGDATQRRTIEWAKEGAGAVACTSHPAPRWFILLQIIAGHIFYLKHTQYYILFILNQNFNKCTSQRFILQLQSRHSSWFKDMGSVLQNPELLVSTFSVENTWN